MVVRTRVFESGWTTEHENPASVLWLFSSTLRSEQITGPAVVPQCNILGCPSGRAPTRGIYRGFSAYEFSRPDLFHYGAEGPSDRGRCCRGRRGLRPAESVACAKSRASKPAPRTVHHGGRRSAPLRRPRDRNPSGPAARQREHDRRLSIQRLD